MNQELLSSYHSVQKKEKKKIFVSYNSVEIRLTEKQIQTLKLLSKGFSNSRIARNLYMKECTIKIMVYRLMKYLEFVFQRKIDRFSLIIIAQEIVSCL